MKYQSHSRDLKILPHFLMRLQGTKLKALTSFIPTGVRTTAAVLGWLWIFPATIPALGESAYTEVFIQNHRCLVVGPANLPSQTPMILMLHGFGTNGFEQLFLLDRLHLPPCLVVCPDGPLPVAHSSAGAHAWYDRFTHSRKDMEKSRDYLFEVLDHFSKDRSGEAVSGETFKPRPVIIMGFSQGACMALETGLNYKGNIEGIISMSGFIEYPEKTLARPRASRRTPILRVRGILDPVVQEDDTQETMKSLRGAGYQPELRESMMGHKINYFTITEV